MNTDLGKDEMLAGQRKEEWDRKMDSRHRQFVRVS
jgi:Txe/YoeB family toxin of Txe-Axe toxin-antitoxin module